MHRRGTAATTPSAARTTTPDYLREDDEELLLVPSTASAVARPLRGILRLLEGQIVFTRNNRASTFGGEWAATRLGDPYEQNDAADGAFVAMHRYHGPTLRESHSNLQKQKRKKRQRRRIQITTDTTTTSSGSETQPIVGGSSSQSGLEKEQQQMQHPHSWTRLDNVISRHKFVAIFVVQGVANASGNFCYSRHMLELRKILATDYHDVLTTLVLDVGNGSSHHNNSNNPMLPSLGSDEETGDNGNDDDSPPHHHPFCIGTGFGLLPLSSTTTSTALALLNVTKIPSLIIVDAKSGRIVSRDAILAVERNDSHGVVNRWQAGKSGLTLFQQLVAAATCDCHHGPCCDGGCAIQ